jgi:hypothetical protein
MAGDQLADAAHERSRRGLISTSWFLVCSSLRAVNSARISCAGRDLQCTGRNQLSRICWAMPRTSLRSVLTGIALPAKTSALRSSLAVPAPDARARPFTEFFAATIRNKNASMALRDRVPVYVEQPRSATSPTSSRSPVAAYIEALQATVAKLHLPAIRMLFDWLVVRS